MPSLHVRGWGRGKTDGWPGKCVLAPQTWPRGPAGDPTQTRTSDMAFSVLEAAVESPVLLPGWEEGPPVSNFTIHYLPVPESLALLGDMFSPDKRKLVL